MKHLFLIIIFLLVSVPSFAQTKVDNKVENDELVLKIEDICGASAPDLCVITAEEFIQFLPNAYKGIKFPEDIRINSFRTKTDVKVKNNVSAEGISYSPPSSEFGDKLTFISNLTEGELQEAESIRGKDDDLLYIKSVYEGRVMKGFIKDKPFRANLTTYWYKLYDCDPTVEGECDEDY